MNPEALGVTPDLSMLEAPPVWLKLLASLLVVLLFWALRVVAARLIRGRTDLLSDSQRWWISLSRNAFSFAAFLCVVLIWSAEIEAFALSIAAVAVAFVVATKELLLCVTGATWRGLSQPFSVGDWIEIGPHSGEVIEETVLATVLQEIDPVDFNVTGRVVSVPNSLLLTQPVVNNSFRKRFITLSFSLHDDPVVRGLDGVEARRLRIEEALRATAADFADISRRYAARIEKSAGTRLRDPTPQVTLDTTDLGKVAYRVTAFCPRDRASQMRAAAMRAYLAP
jgi:small-conductance mechanosensitive channel